LNDPVATRTETTGLQDTAAVVSDETTTTSLSVVSADTTSVPATVDIPPLQFGDLSELGLVSWTPAGFVRWSIEAVQVSTGMPWFHTIVVTTLLYRIVLLPLGIKALRNSARLLPMTPRLLEVKQDMEAARASGDILAAQRVALKQKKIYTDAGVEMSAMILNPFVQLPVTLGLFFGVKGMCTLPVEQLKNSGLAVLQDLTVPDPYFVLPAIATALINLQISVRRDVFFGLCFSLMTFVLKYIGWI
jgi:YidC/Oxa1 family membrane protein insertase